MLDSLMAQSSEIKFAILLITSSPLGCDSTAAAMNTTVKNAKAKAAKISHVPKNIIKDATVIPNENAASTVKIFDFISL